MRRAHSGFETRQNFYIFCEGDRTEPDYFEALKKLLDPKMNINMEFPLTGAVAYTIAKSAVEFRNSNSHSHGHPGSIKKNDQVWAVFDRDTHPNFSEAVRLCKENNVFVGRSNPCFEVWLILHFQDFNAPIVPEVSRNALVISCGKRKFAIEQIVIPYWWNMFEPQKPARLLS